MQNGVYMYLISLKKICFLIIYTGTLILFVRWNISDLFFVSSSRVLNIHCLYYAQV